MNPVDVMLWAGAGILILSFIFILILVIAMLSGIRKATTQTTDQKEAQHIQFDL